MRRFLTTTCFGLFYLASILIADCFDAGAPWQDGIGHALIFGTFFFAVSFPLLLLLQAGLKRLLTRRFASLRERTLLWEFLPMAVVSLLFLLSIADTLPESRVRRLVVDPLPSSMHDARVWYRRGFGNSSWVICFRIAPEDFDRLLSRHPYKRADRPQGHELAVLQMWLHDRSDFPIAYPDEPMVVSYTYTKLASPGHNDNTDITIYANAKRDLVYAMGGDG